MVKVQHNSAAREGNHAVDASVKAREMIIDLCGERGWNDTRESWFARGARRVGTITARRVRAIFHNEPIRLSANEYLDIERAYVRAHAALEKVSSLARSQDVRESGGLGGSSGQANPREHAGAGPAARSDEEGR